MVKQDSWMAKRMSKNWKKSGGANRKKNEYNIVSGVVAIEFA